MVNTAINKVNVALLQHKTAYSGLKKMLFLIILHTHKSVLENVCLINSLLDTFYNYDNLSIGRCNSLKCGRY